MDQYVTIRKRPRVDVTQLYPDVWRLVAGVLEWPEVISLYRTSKEISVATYQIYIKTLRDIQLEYNTNYFFCCCCTENHNELHIRIDGYCPMMLVRRNYLFDNYHVYQFYWTYGPNHQILQYLKMILKIHSPLSIKTITRVLGRKWVRFARIAGYLKVPLLKEFAN